MSSHRGINMFFFSPFEVTSISYTRQKNNNSILGPVLASRNLSSNIICQILGLTSHLQPEHIAASCLWLSEPLLALTLINSDWRMSGSNGSVPTISVAHYFGFNVPVAVQLRKKNCSVTRFKSIYHLLCSWHKYAMLLARTRYLE